MGLLRCLAVLVGLLAVASATDTGPTDAEPWVCVYPYEAYEAYEECSLMTNTTCETCLKNVKCLWCNTNSKCVDYPVRNILPPSSLCKLKDARWGICWVNFEAVIIAVSVVGGVLILSLICCCYCCCRKKKNRNSSLDTEKSIREKEERRVRQEERRVQMKSRHDEIRKKYGLFKEDNPYAKFDS